MSLENILLSKYSSLSECQIIKFISNFNDIKNSDDVIFVLKLNKKIVPTIIKAKLMILYKNLNHKQIDDSIIFSMVDDIIKYNSLLL